MVGGEICQGENTLAIISWYLPSGSDDISEDILGHIENRGDFILVGDLNARLPMYDTPSNS